MLNFIRWLFLAVFPLALLTSAQDEPVDERILLTFIPNVQFAPFYVGIEDGYFADAGFNVTLEHLQEPGVLDLVAVGQANYGIVSGEQVILARSRGRDVVYVFEWFQEYPVGIVVQGHDGLGIDSIADLRGRKIGLPGRFGASYTGLTALLHSAGLTEADVHLNEIGFNAPEVYCLKAVTAVVVYINNEPIQIRNLSLAGECSDLGTEFDVFPVADGVDLVSNGLIVSEDLLQNNPDDVQRMVNGLGNALQATINNPARAYLVSLKFVDNLPKDADFIAELQNMAEKQDLFLESSPGRQEINASREEMFVSLWRQFDFATISQFEVLLNSIKLWDAERLGYSDLESWQAMSDTLLTMGFLDEDAGDLGDAFTNRFVAGNDA